VDRQPGIEPVHHLERRGTDRAREGGVDREGRRRKQLVPIALVVEQGAQGLLDNPVGAFDDAVPCG